MTHIRLEATFAVAPHALYDYVTRPARWHEWHPASLGAEEHALESLSAGARFEEDIVSSGFRRRLRWQVVDSRPGARWEAHATMGDGSGVRLLYEFVADGSGTRFTRTLDYEVKPVLLRLLNDLLLWRRVRAESRRAMANLAAVVLKQSEKRSADDADKSQS
jgi:hypothetical protein